MISPGGVVIGTLSVHRSDDEPFGKVGRCANWSSMTVLDEGSYSGTRLDGMTRVLFGTNTAVYVELVEYVIKKQGVELKCFILITIVYVQ